MSAIVVRVSPATWKDFRRTSSASRQMRRLLRLAVQMLLQRTHPVSVSIRHIRLRSTHNQPLISRHYLIGQARARAGGLSPPQWLVHVRAPVTAVLCVTPRNTRAGVTLTVHALAPTTLQRDLRMLAQALEILRREAAQPPTEPESHQPAIVQQRSRRRLTFRGDHGNDAATTEGTG